MRAFLRFAVLTATVVCAAGAQENAPDPRAADLINLMVQAYSHVHQIHLIAEREDRTTSAQIPNASVVLREYEFAEAPGGRYYVRLKEGAELSIKVSDGKTTWKVLPHLKTYSEFAADRVPVAFDDRRGMQAFDTYVAARNMFVRYGSLGDGTLRPEYVRDETLKVGKRELLCGVLTWKTERDTQEIWVDRQTGLVLQNVQRGLQRIHRTNMVTRITVRTKLIETDDVGSAIFHFDPPEGWKKRNLVVFPHDMQDSFAGADAPNFQSKTLDRARFNLEELRGKVVVLDFWASWCVPCKWELPGIQKLDNEFAGKVEFVGVTGEDAGIAERFLRKLHYDMELCIDQRGTIHQLFGVNAIPRLLILDRNGVIKADLPGYRDEYAFRKLINSILAEPAT